uniref:5-Hydroxyisourate Hydrolase (HIUase) n=1 Tax=Nonomuraea gerenzanensis TaxID=93944 RepID=A0A1M4EAY0_9ACTN|nr:5-Hydroxyisourate Hydrolase (HIUase) [Nonomuraea gerenzanensis]
MEAQDAVYGRPAAGMEVRLERMADTQWMLDGKSEIGPEGFVREWLTLDLSRGLYRVVFCGERYFGALGLSSAYPEISVMFRMLGDQDASAYKIQVWLSPYSYSTYFGSRI